MSNSWDAEIATLAPSHYWKLDELAGDYIDTGATAGLDLTEAGAGAPWRQAPSMVIRGAPRQFGMWSAVGSAGFSVAVRTASGLVVIGHITGTFLASVFHFSEPLSGLAFPLQQTYLNNAGLWCGIRINANGSAEFRCQANVNFNSGVSAAGAIVEGTPYVLMGAQRADGTGMHIFINGVDATVSATQGGTAGIDDYIDQIQSGFTASDLAVGAAPNTFGGAGNVTGTPGVWVNTALTDQQIADLFTATGGLEQTPSDYFETLAKVCANEYRNYIGGWNLPGAGLRALQLGNDIGGFGTLSAAILFDSPPSAVNVADSGGKGEQRVSAYPTFHYLFGSNNPSLNADPDTNMDAANDDVGTINVVVKISSAPVGIRKTAVAFGIFNTTELEVGIIGGILGYSVLVRFRGTSGSGDFWQATSVINTFPSTDIKMFTFVQDGTGVLIYIDGELEAFVASFSGASRDETDWISTGFTASTVERFGSQSGSGTLDNFQPNELHDVLVTRTIFSAADVAELWDALNGEFLPAGTPGAFFDELDTLGNGGAGPDWWWRMNVLAGLLLDVGSAQDRPGPTPPPINGSAIVELGNPQHSTPGPLGDDPTNASIFFDGLTDAFEIGVNAVAGELVASSTGSIGFFFSRASLDDENIVYSQGNDAYTAFWQFGMNAKRLELIVQTSAGNRVTLTGSIEHGGEYIEAVLTCDGSRYRLYDGGVEDTLATLVELGTGAEGDWFDAFTADQSAVGARADATFTTETTGRASEIFIYDGEVLTSSEIAALAAAAVVDGITGTANTVGLITFENVTFRNGAFADIRAEESTGTFKQVVKVNRCKFLAGAQGSATYKPQVAIFKGPAQVQFRGCEFDLEDTPVFGRGGIIGTAVNTLLSATVDGSMIVSDCDFIRMGFLDGSDFLSPVMCQAAFGMTVEDNRFTNSLGTAVGWNADAQRVSVLDNQIQGTSQALSAIHAARALNARVGSGWTIRGNKMLDIGGNAIDLNGGTSGGVAFARNIAILANETNAISGSAIRINELADVLVEDNVGSGSTFGVELVAIQDSIVVRRNDMNGCALTAYFAGEATLQLADVTFDRNKGDNLGTGGDGLLVTQVQRADILNNKLLNMNNGVGIGEITVEAVFAGNQIEATTPFQILGGTTQVDFKVGRNMLESLGNATEIVVDGTAIIEVIANYHTISAAAIPLDLDTINGPQIDGFILVLRRALFSQNITLRDGVDNLQLGSDFVMDVDNDQIWLVRDGTDWHQVSRVEAL